MADNSVPEHEAVNSSLDVWLAEFRKPKSERSKWHEDYNFPSDKIRDEYIANIGERDEVEVRMLLESFLIESGVMGLDHYNLVLMKQSKEPEKPDETQYRKRLRRVIAGEKNVHPWEGITWVLDLLRVEPREAISVLDAYFVTHAVYLPDGRIYGLGDATTLIRAYYLGLPDSPEEALQLLLQLPSRDMEHLLDELYTELGYRTELTPKQKDGGRDIIATKTESGHTVTIYIESKNWTNPVSVEEVRALYGVIESARIEKGLLMGTNGFTKGKSSATEFADNNHRIDLLTGMQLIELLGKTYGRKWPQDIDRIIRNSKQRDYSAADN